MENDKTNFPKWILPVSIIGIVILWSITPFFSRVLLPELSDRGLAGDMFGSINALFSGLALAGVIIAIVLQSRELEHQREELKLTREELHGQKEQMELQNENIRLQTFESTFFGMFNSHLSLVESFDVTGAVGKTTQGKRIFEYIYTDWKNKFEEELTKNPTNQCM